jgi:hypothetical protein
MRVTLDGLWMRAFLIFPNLLKLGHSDTRAAQLWKRTNAIASTADGSEQASTTVGSTGG